MKKRLRFTLAFSVFAALCFHSSASAQTEDTVSPAYAQDSLESGDDVFEYNPGEVNFFTGEGVNIGGFIFPELFMVGNGGLAENEDDIPRFASSEHDPQNKFSIQAIELDLHLEINDQISGLIAGGGFQVENEVWEAELEEAFLHFELNDTVTIGGGQYLSTFGFQGDKHVHTWDFVNQNLINGRMLNEGHLIMQGGEVLINTPGNGQLTLAMGGIYSHEHGHGHEEEEEHGHEEEEGHHDEEEEEHHLEADEAGFSNWAFAADYKFRLPFDDTVTVSTSIVTGENGFGGEQLLYGAGIEKVWNGHDHGNGGPEFCTNALLLRSEFMGRNTEAIHEDGDREKFNDYGVSTMLAYGLNETSTVSFRHDWVSDLEGLELQEVHRFSPAFTTFIDPGQRVRMRLQYDNVQNSAIETEHVGWLQFQIQWGGQGGPHHNHDH